MAWLLFGVLQIIVIAAGIRKEQRAGLWSWSKFAFAVGFGLLQCTILIAPVKLMGVTSPRFIPVFVACWVIAAINFVWMIVVARRWKLPDGRTSIKAYRDEQKVEAQLEQESRHT
jgi:hypothetical protein